MSLQFSVRNGGFKISLHKLDINSVVSAHKKATNDCTDAILCIMSIMSLVCAIIVTRQTVIREDVKIQYKG